MYCQPLERTGHLLLSLEWTVHALSAFRMDSASLPEFRKYSACSVSLWNGQCMYFKPLQWTVHLLSTFGMNSSCTARL